MIFKWRTISRKTSDACGTPSWGEHPMVNIRQSLNLLMATIPKTHKRKKNYDDQE
jgi:hypothetical protein